MRLGQLGLKAETLNLRDYFTQPKELESLVRSIGAVFVMGGNVFVLRQAMKLCGLDDVLVDLNNNRDFLYSGYSAAGCVLGPTLEPYKVVGDATLTP